MHAWSSRLADRIRPRLPFLARASRYAFTLLLVVVLVYQLARDWNGIRQSPWRLDWPLFVGAFLIYTANLALSAYLWNLIMQTLAGVKGYWTHLRLLCLSNPARRLPSPVFYMGARAASYHSVGVSGTTTVSASLIETLVTSMGGLVVVLASVGLAAPNYSAAWTLVLLVPAAVVAFKPALLIQGFNVVLRKVRRPPIEVELRRSHIFRWMPVAVLMFVVGGLMLYLLVSTVYAVPLSALPSIINAFAVSWLIGTAVDFLFSIPNAAIRQVTLAYLLTSCVPLPVAIAGTLLERFAVLGFEMVWAAVFTKLRL